MTSTSQSPSCQLSRRSESSPMYRYERTSFLLLTGHFHAWRGRVVGRVRVSPCFENARCRLAMQMAELT